MKSTFADKVLDFYQKLHPIAELPVDIEIINPYQEAETFTLASHFYRKFYNDPDSRVLIIGINPGRFGGAVTGVPFTDPKRYIEKCGLQYSGALTHEPSSVFVYEVIDAYGGVEAFYRQFYINSVFPLALTFKGKNYNYYDSKETRDLLLPAILENLQKQIDLGIRTDICFCLGLKNYDFLTKLNNKHHFFKEIIPLEHPRYIVQYQSKHKDAFVEKYISALKGIR